MNLIFRLIWLLVSTSRRKCLELIDESTLTLRVLPTDLDVNMHMTNARYLSVMDLGRTKLIVQTGMLKELLKRRWLPVVASVHLKFFKQINPFQRYQLISRVIGWDEKWFYIEQRFEVSGKPVAVGVIKGLFKGREGKVPTDKLLKLAKYEGDALALPEDIRALFES